ncbi:hypothetical protein [Paenibacillus sp. 1781tsa1]|uniref:hypothetical protein n=1 Tax=Paenibacillus sp. 1781tsa1 TaxID=2953810 RepID=UPI00209E093B|nr:hypothetical protein [Paenibacillus sp. 1781tsa1]MCP1186491.1 hypothetical protein [Paenibacillus sp. 1781tsa1]
MKKKLTVVMSSLLLLGSLASAAYAQPISSPNNDLVTPTVNDIEARVSSSISTSNVFETPEDPIITPFDVTLIRPFPYDSVNAYENTFYIDPRNGLEANIWLQNTGTSTIYMKIYVDNNLDMEIPFAVGQQKTINLYGTVAHSYKIYVYNSVGAVNKFNISARQF